MPDDDDLVIALVARLRRIGSDTTSVEVKAAAGGFPKSVGESVSAFANGSGGIVLLGLAEADGFRPAPGFDAQAIRDALAGLCHDEMEPPIRSDIEIVPFRVPRSCTSTCRRSTRCSARATSVDGVLTPGPSSGRVTAIVGSRRTR
ncbi:helix-turn-helix domain-containing protein [Cellulomonas cellasea]|uniref:Schlafen AlbA-2 domain-containing protein n=1 Tax=Cellulomonas cellasea TaxID=43670 RepID=A0A7W4UHI1_9CELL|nr:ATP-binding protein [Cellulomonas cellasea]MBB2924261.1 hypothetical protein [Cellulomonas cellasea]